MKFSLSRADLLTSLASLNRIVEKRNTIPILSNIKITTGYDTVDFEATDLDLALTRRIGVGREGEVVPGTITVPAHILGDIVRKIPDGALISIEHKDDLVIRSGRSRFTLQTLPSVDFPEMTFNAKAESEFSITGYLLLDVLTRTEFAMSTEEHRYYLCGICLHDMEDGKYRSLVAVATDGHRLAHVRILPNEAISLGDAPIPRMIVPRKAVAALKMLASEAGAQRIKIEMTANKIQATHEYTVLVSKLVDGQFPDYQRVIPTSNSNRISLESDHLARGLELVSTVSSEKGRAAKWEIRESDLQLTVNNPDSGSAEEIVETVFEEGKPLQIGFNTRYALDMVAALKSERIEATFGDSGSPAIFRPFIGPSGIDHLVILMPMRV